ncbi:carboxypeptidase-like regulatory domain-containing protein [Frigoriglobus tundricola]|uniref:Carboxypeptidase regulatory-like domain-containing protein n=1 Tax=Frigoriglobus tundricola TaxID=2774151 RepID=A0A6M5Z5L8_9BACT|nr:carboxypeptidase-like regulatory domain-containing protein [Frigoriglobus tundricola]QJX00852.1 hypothetical protein FTUN_8490 [Frigoriglobus tundricola]
MWTRRTKQTLTVAVIAFLSGCGGSGDLTGTVRYRDQPLSSGTVQVRGADGIVRSAPIESDGTYTIPNLPTGAVAVSVTCRDPREVEYSRAKAAGGRGGPPTSAAKAGGKVASQEGFSLIPAAYSELERSGLGTTLRSGPNRYDIDLK